jgi:GNAT superfamily N-acetyltransferase
MSSEPSFTFRAAGAADVAAVAAVVESAYRGDSCRLGWTNEADLLDGRRTDAVEVAELVARPFSRVLLAERDGVLLASCHIEKQGDACYFGMFAVDPRQQGGGTGKALLAAAEQVARDEWGCIGVKMTVIDLRVELVAWYERRGYRRTGEFRPFPYGDIRCGIPLRDDLRFELLLKTFSPEVTA